MKEFRNYIDDVLKKKYKNKSDRDLVRDDIQAMMAAANNEFYGRIFYLILKKLEEDIDKACEKLFANITPTVLNDHNKDKSKLANFIMPYTRTETEISDAALIDGARFSRVKNKILPDLYAYEVYGLAIALNLKPSYDFKYFYADEEETVVETEKK